MLHQTKSEMIQEYKESYYRIFNTMEQVRQRCPETNLTKYGKELARLTMLIEGLKVVRYANRSEDC